MRSDGLEKAMTLAAEREGGGEDDQGED